MSLDAFRRDQPTPGADFRSRARKDESPIPPLTRSVGGRGIPLLRGKPDLPAGLANVARLIAVVD